MEEPRRGEHDQGGGGEEAVKVEDAADYDWEQWAHNTLVAALGKGHKGKGKGPKGGGRDQKGMARAKEEVAL